MRRSDAGFKSKAKREYTGYLESGLSKRSNGGDEGEEGEVRGRGDHTPEAYGSPHEALKPLLPTSFVQGAPCLPLPER